MNFSGIFRNVLRPIRVLPPEDAYRLWAPTYDDRAGNAVLFLEEQAMLPLMRRLVLPGMNMVDFGCGTGRHIIHALECGVQKVVGVDLSWEMLGIARKKLSTNGVHFVQARLQSLPFTQAQFDLGISSLVLSHIKNLDQCVCAMSSLIRTGGILILSDLHHSFEERGWHRTFKSNLSPGKRLAVQNFTHTPVEYREAFRRANVEVETEFEPCIDVSLRPFFERQGMIETYEKFVGKPLLTVYHLKKR